MKELNAIAISPGGGVPCKLITPHRDYVGGISWSGFSEPSVELLKNLVCFAIIGDGSRPLRAPQIKFGLRSVFAFVLIAALLMIGWQKYQSPQDKFLEVQVVLKDWDIAETTRDELSILLQRSIPADKRTLLTVFVTGIDGVLIKPGETCIWFQTRFRSWDRTKAIERMNKVIHAFLSEEPRLKINHFELQEYTREVKANSLVKRGLRKKTSKNYPL